MEKSHKNGYMLWLSENRDGIRKMYFDNYQAKVITKSDGKEMKENVTTLIAKKAGEIWKSLDPETKQKYKSDAVSSNVSNSEKPKKEEALTGLDKTVLISNELCLFMDLDLGALVSKQDVTIYLTDYIKTKGLQDVCDKRKILPDKKLRKLLNVSDKDEVTYFNLQKYLKVHFVKSNPPFEPKKNLKNSKKLKAPPSDLDNPQRKWKLTENGKTDYKWRSCKNDSLYLKQGWEPFEEFKGNNSKKGGDLSEDETDELNDDSSFNETFIADNTPPPYIETETVAPVKSKSKKRKAIPKAIKMAVWYKYIDSVDENNLKGKCFVGCGNMLTINEFDLGHVNAVSMGGDDTIDNLRPICALCNKSMGNQNLLEFKEQYGLDALDQDDISLRIDKLSKRKTEFEKKSQLKNSIIQDHKLTVQHSIVQNEDLTINNEELHNQLLKLEEKYQKSVNTIKTQLLENESKHTLNVTEIFKNNEQIKILEDIVLENSEKILSLENDITRYYSRLDILIELENKRIMLLKKEVEEEVKLELERERIKLEVKTKLLKSNKTEEVIDLINL